MSSSSGFENLTGDVARDDFIIASGRSVSGTIDGGVGVNTLDYTTYGSAVTVDLGAGASTGAAHLANMSRIVGSAAADTLRGPNADVAWSITGSNAGQVNGVAFSAFEFLAGTDAHDDAFTVRAGGSISGALAGGSGGFDGLAIEDPAHPGTLRIIMPDASGAGTLLQNAVYAGVPTLAYSGIEQPLRAVTVGNDVTFYGSAFKTPSASPKAARY